MGMVRGRSRPPVENGASEHGHPVTAAELAAERGIKGGQPRAGDDLAADCLADN